MRIAQSPPRVVSVVQVNLSFPSFEAKISDEFECALKIDEMSGSFQAGDREAAPSFFICPVTASMTERRRSLRLIMP
jgi:hypothetical protein